MEAVGVSLTTVRKALDPEFAERPRPRHRAAGAARYAARKDDPAYRAYQQAWEAEHAEARVKQIVSRRRERTS